MRSIRDTQRRLLQRIQTEGVEAAYEASLAVARDDNAPAPARATASATLFRVAGYFEKRDVGSTKEPHEMTPEEIAEALAVARLRLASAERDCAAGEGTDIFA